MSDIVELLGRPFSQDTDGNLFIWPELCDEAAKEIRRLRYENAMLKADNASLRAALQGYQSWHK